jgi:glycosyltransferase involved in cell wall biosynthesis
MPVSSLEYRWIPVVGTAVGSDYGSGLPTFLDAAKIILDSGVEAEFVLAELGTGTALARRLADGLAMAERLTITEGIALERSFWPVIDLYAHTSRLPSSGRPLLAAMAHGIPSIASDVAGLRSIAGDGRPARIVPAGDAQALAHEILELLSERETALELGLRGRARIVSEYSPEREADAQAVFDELELNGDGAGKRELAESATFRALLDASPLARAA